MTPLSKTLLELASRVEGASGPSRHLDTQVFILLDPDARHIVGQVPGPFPQEPIYGPRSTYWEWAIDESVDPPEFAPVPAYTASLDAAMTLKPAGSTATINIFDDDQAAVMIDKGDWHYASTPALALTVACLRARADVGQSDE